MFIIDIKLTENLLPALEKRIKNLSKRHVSVGMWESQGVHKPSGFNYVDLFKYLSDGNPLKMLPPRSPLQTVVALRPLKVSPLRSDLNKYLSNLEGQPVVGENAVLENLGSYYRKEVRDVFGSSLLAPKAESTKRASKSKNTPLIETGELAKQVAYKIDNQGPEKIGS